MNYIISQDWNKPFAKDVELPSDLHRLDFFTGKMLPNTPNTIVRLGSKNAIKQDSIVNSSMLLFLNHKLINLLQEVNNNVIQLCPIDIFDSKGIKQDSSHMLINILVLLDAIDKNKSELKYSPAGVILGIKRLVLDESVIKNYDIFRLKDCPGLTVVSEYLFSKLKLVNPTGINFIPIEEFRM